MKIDFDKMSAEQVEVTLNLYAQKDYDSLVRHVLKTNAISGCGTCQLDLYSLCKQINDYEQRQNSN